jgi:folate-dependent phosphoribosylglycinamide formyltransferase PurN
VSKPLLATEGRKARVAIFLSGGGSNARVILARHRELGARSPIDPVALVTDRPNDEGCGAARIGQEFGVPVVGHDVRAFYRVRGLARVSVANADGMRAREAWTDALREKIAPYAIDLAVFAGFELLCNIAADFPCLNVHPGDLTYLRGGARYLVGLHTMPIERALLCGLGELRSSVIVVTPYRGGGTEDMDRGPLLGISTAVPIDLCGRTREELAAVAARRPAVRPPGGFGDALEEVARHNQGRLKEGGDWLVFPPVVFMAAAGCYALGEDDRVLFRVDAGQPFRPVARLVFGSEGIVETA